MIPKFNLNGCRPRVQRPLAGLTVFVIVSLVIFCSMGEVDLNLVVGAYGWLSLH